MNIELSVSVFLLIIWYNFRVIDCFVDTIALALILCYYYDCSTVLTFRNLIQRGKNPHKYIKYTPDELDQLLGQFFLGK